MLVEKKEIINFDHQLRRSDMLVEKKEIINFDHQLRRSDMLAAALKNQCTRVRRQ